MSKMILVYEDLLYYSTVVFFYLMLSDILYVSCKTLPTTLILVVQFQVVCVFVSKAPARGPGKMLCKISTTTAVDRSYTSHPEKKTCKISRTTALDILVAVRVYPTRRTSMCCSRSCRYYRLFRVKLSRSVRRSYRSHPANVCERALLLHRSRVAIMCV